MIAGRAPAFDPIPLAVDTVLDPGWLGDALDLVATGERITDVTRIGSSKTIAEKVRFEVTVEGGDGLRRLPLCVKAHFGDGMNSLLTEAHFYRDARPVLPVRAPQAHHVGIDDEQGLGLIVMDDVIGLGGRFFDPDQPYSIETCRDTLGQLAALHAATWGDQRWDVPAFGSRIEWMGTMFPPEALQELLDDGRAVDLPPYLRDASRLQAAMSRTAELAPTCLIHGDTHSGNAYLDADGSACWLDWQIAQWGHWSIDVSYHLGTVLDVETRRAHEADLLRHYLETLARHGIEPPSFDAAWDSYASGFAWGYFLWVITRISSRQVVLLHIPRLGAALSDHDTFRRLGVDR